MNAKLKTMALAAALTAGLAGMAAAGPGGRRSGPERIQARVERMRTELGLSDDQAQRIEQILSDAAAQRDGERQGDGERRSDDAREQRGRRGGMRGEHRETFERIQSVLTPEQRERMVQLRQERRDRSGDGRLRPEGGNF